MMCKNTTHSLLRRDKTIWIGVALGLLLVGCASIDMIPPPLDDTPVPVSTATPLPEITATPPAPPSPVETATLTPTPTITPVVLLDTPAHVDYVLPLVVQHVTETSATLYFELSGPAEGVLLYWPAEIEQAQSRLPLSSTEARHQITLTGLEPGVIYQATVGILAEGDTYREPYFLDQRWGAVSSRTASGREPLRVGVLGDSGFGGSATFALVEEMAAYDLDFVLHTGDVVYQIYDNADPYEAYALKWYKPFAPLLHRMPIYPVVGNHDVEAAAQWNGVPFYYHAFPPFVDPRFETSAYEGRNQWYAFAYGSIQFLMLDTQTFFGEVGRAEQDTWLIERLADGRFRHTIPVFHVAAYTSGIYPDDGISVRQNWVPQFEAANVPLVFSGHDHNYQRLLVEGIMYVVSGGGSATLYQSGQILPESLVFARETHFVLMEIYEDRIELRSIALGGELLDQATIQLQQP